MAKKRIDDYPRAKEIRQHLLDGSPDDLVALFIPSHDRHDKPIPDQDVWQSAAMALFAKIFTGATVFESLKGVFQPDGVKEPMLDEPTMIEALVQRKRLNDENLCELEAFCQNMGRATNQHTVGVVVNNKFISVVIKHDDK